jgi:hypothetical protein
MLRLARLSLAIGIDRFSNMKATHRRLLVELCKALKLEVPGNILFALGDSSDQGNSNGAPKPDPKKDSTTKPGASPKD